MSFDAGSIISRLTLDKEGFTSGILSANALTQTFGSHITAFMANPLIEAGNLLKELGTTLWDWGKEAAEAANGQRRMAEAMGSSVEFVGGLEYAFKRCHVPVEMMRLEMSRLVHDMASADSGATPAGRALAELGISARDSSGQMRPMKDVLLEVADTGKGFPSEDRDRLFLPYYSTKRPTGGLGLPIVRRIVVEHGGEIRIEENQPKGTRVIIELPALAPAAA